MKARKRSASGRLGKKGEKKRNVKEAVEDPVDTESFFLTDDINDAIDSENEEEEILETAEEKRLRLAKAYLKQLRSSGAQLDDNDADDGNAVLDDDELAAKLKLQAQEAGGYLQRQIAQRISVPETEASTSGQAGHHASTFYRCHRDATTAMALTFDDATLYSVGKEGSIIRLDIESGKKSNPEWVKKSPGNSHAGVLLAAAVSFDGQLLAVGGGDRKVHVWDTRSEQLVQSYPGHKDAITGLAFRHGTHELYSSSYDRSIKIWSLDDQAYVDTLFGHQAEVLAVDALRQQRIVSSGHDHTCRVWKVAEESQLIYRGYATAIDCCRYVTGTEWITGGNDGMLSLWSQMKKKPAWRVHNAHAADQQASKTAPAESGWIQSVAVCRGSDLVGSGAADGSVRLWQVKRGLGNNKTLEAIGAFPAPGYVNALAIASSGRFVLAGLGQEPRLGRWGRESGTRSGLLLQPLLLKDE